MFEKYYIYPALAFVISSLVMFAVRAFVRKRFATMADKTETILDDVIVEIAKKTNRFFIIVLSVYIAQQFADVSHVFKLRVHQALTVITGIQIFMWLDAVISIFVNERFS